MAVNIVQINDTGVPTNSGNLNDATLRVCIATNDVNLSNMNSKINTVQSDIDAIKADIEIIKNALSDVWNTSSHTLKVSIL